MPDTWGFTPLNCCGKIRPILSPSQVYALLLGPVAAIGVICRALDVIFIEIVNSNCIDTNVRGRRHSIMILRSDDKVDLSVMRPSSAKIHVRAVLGDFPGLYSPIKTSCEGEAAEITVGR